MKIALFHELPLGGARIAANDFARFLKKDNNIVDLYFVSDKELKEEYINYSNVNYYKFNWHGLNKRNWIDILKNDTIDLVRLYALHKKIAAKINKGNYDITFVHASRLTQAPFILRFLKPKKVYYCQEVLRIVYEKGFEIPEGLGFFKHNYERVNRMIRKKIDFDNLKKADLILTNSKFTQSLVKKSYGFKNKVLYLGIDSSHFKPRKIKKDIDIFFIGGKNKLHGYDLLEKALSLLNDRKLYVMVHDGKWMTDKELLRTYNRSKIVANLEYHQPFGLIALESMACEVPVITLNDSAYKETIVDGVNGFMVNEPKRLSKTIKKLLNDPKLRERIGEQGRKSVLQKWDWKIRIKELENIFYHFK